MSFTSQFRNRILLTLALLLAMVWAAPSFHEAAQAGKRDYPEPRRMLWMPTYGYTNTTEPQSCLLETYCHRVREGIEWTEWPSVQQLDYPRTPSQQGNYEHELRFKDGSTYDGAGDDASRPYWCDPGVILQNGSAGAPYDDLYTNFPSGYYYDSISSDPGEFSFGIPGWKILEDRLYTIDFRCSPSRDVIGQTYPASVQWQQPPTGSYSLIAQIGHCDWRGCGSAGFSDTSNAALSRFQTTSPGDFAFDASFDGSWSLEYDYGYGVNVAAGSRARRCGDAWHGNCYWNLRPASSGSRVYAYVDTSEYVNDADNEWVVRCPDSQNIDNCRVRLWIRGYDSSGRLTDTFWGSWFTINPDTWWTFSQQTVADHSNADFDFPSSTVKYRFAVQAYTGDYIDVDYHNTRLQR